MRTELLYNPAGIGCREILMLKETYSMKMLPVTAEHRPAIPEISRGTDAAVKYEHSGYQIRVYFRGEKTFSQCIRNMAERRGC